MGTMAERIKRFSKTLRVKHRQNTDIITAIFFGSRVTNKSKNKQMGTN